MRAAEFEIREGEALDVLRRLPDGIAQTCVTSPPYYGLRDYGHDGQLGLEDTPGEYVARLVEILGEVRRVLRDDGTLWLNLGDSYCSRPAGNQPGDLANSGLTNPQRQAATRTDVNKTNLPGLKPKDLIGVPWRVALALQDDGWYLRKEVIWDKPNPMPEAVRDRPTSSHEHVFLLAKSGNYFYDLDGYREPSVSESPAGNGFKREHRVGHDGQGVRASDEKWQMTDTRQIRDVWRVPTVPFPGAHFAVFPPEIPLRCIRLGSSPRACHACGSPWWRIVRRRRLLDGEPITGSWDGDGTGRRMGALGVGHWRFSTGMHEEGWRPTCTCGAPQGVEPGDLDEVESPTSNGTEPDPSLEVGRRGLARPRNGEGGTRPVTRWEQRHIARQLAGSPRRTDMEAEAGREAFAHYLRSDRSGARPPRPALLDAWRERGWVDHVEPPPPWWDEDDASRCLVLDPFAGAGTTGLVAVDEGRDFLGVELNADYAQMARDRIRDRAQAPRFEFL